VTKPEIGGVYPPSFEAARAVFSANFEEGAELGARYSLAIDGEIVVDLWAGSADHAQTKPFNDRTPAPVFSTTKAVTALMVARMVGQRRLAYGQRISEVGPVFGQGGRSTSTSSRRCRTRRGYAVCSSRWTRRCGSIGTQSAGSWRRWRPCGYRAAPAATIR
jgi:hypothetical protein